MINYKQIIYQKCAKLFDYFDRNKVKYYFDEKKEIVYVNDPVFFKQIENYNNNKFIFPDNIVFKNDLYILKEGNYIFGNTQIYGNFVVFLTESASKPNINIQFSGEKFKVKENAIFNNVCVDIFPKDFLVAGCQFMFTNSEFKKFGDNFSIFSKNISFDNSNFREFPPSLIKSMLSNQNRDKSIGEKMFLMDEIDYYENIHHDNKSYNYDLKLSLNNLKNDGIFIPESLKLLKVYISCNDTFIENSYLFKNYDVHFYFGEKYNFNNFYDVDLTKNICKTNNNYSIVIGRDISEINGKNIINNIIYPNLIKKLTLERFDQITKMEKLFFKENKEKIEEYIKFDENNIIYYSYTPRIIDYLVKNGYNFTEKEYELITEPNIKRLYKKYL